MYERVFVICDGLVACGCGCLCCSIWRGWRMGAMGNIGSCGKMTFQMRTGKSGYEDVCVCLVVVVVGGGEYDYPPQLWLWF